MTADLRLLVLLLAVFALLTLSCGASCGFVPCEEGSPIGPQTSACADGGS